MIVGAAALAGIVLFWLDRVHPSLLPPWAPWEFSWPIFAATVLGGACYARGVALCRAEERPGPWRQSAFWAGLLLTYAVTQSRIDFLALHLFFVHRAQHLVLHHLGPFLMALGAPGGVFAAGLPEGLRRALRRRWLDRAMNLVQNPIIAILLFDGFIYLWLIPSVHFRVMLDERLYGVMNWSMVLDGLLYWSLILDPRPAPPARVGYLMRLVMLIVMMPPQILLGAIITFSRHDLFPAYEICGRVMAISALDDQNYGGLIIWIPGAMMSLPAVLLVLTAMRHNEEATSNAQQGSNVAP